MITRVDVCSDDSFILEITKTGDDDDAVSVRGLDYKSNSIEIIGWKHNLIDIANAILKELKLGEIEQVKEYQIKVYK